MTPKKETTAVSTTGQKALTTPSQAPRGFDNFDMKDMILPRLRLLQNTSKAVSDGAGKLGDFQDSLTEEVLGNKVEMVLLGMKNGAVYFKQGEGMVCKSDDGIVNKGGVRCDACPFGEYWAKFHDDGTPPGCSGTKDFIGIVRPTLKAAPYPMVVSFMKTSYGIGKRIASMARLTGRDMFARSYSIGSEKTENKKGKFAKFDPKPGTDLDPEEFATAERWYYLLVDPKTKKEFQVHEDTDVVEEV